MCDSLWYHGLYSLWDSPGQNTGVGSWSFLQGIIPTHGLNPALPHCRWIFYQLSHQGSPHNKWCSDSCIHVEKYETLSYFTSCTKNNFKWINSFHMILTGTFQHSNISEIRMFWQWRIIVYPFCVCWKHSLPYSVLKKLMVGLIFDDDLGLMKYGGTLWVWLGK